MATISAPASTAKVPLETYLRTSYRPDKEYIDGELQEKSMGQWDHEQVIIALVAYFKNVLGDKGYLVTQNTRMFASKTRVRLPDVAVLAPGSRRTSVLAQTPLLIIEVSSPTDALYKFKERLRDYQAMKVEHVWILDPYRKAGYAVTPGEPPKLELCSVLDLPGAGVSLDLEAFYATIPWSEDMRVEHPDTPELPIAD